MPFCGNINNDIDVILILFYTENLALSKYEDEFPIKIIIFQKFRSKSKFIRRFKKFLKFMFDNMQFYGCINTDIEVVLMLFLSREL